MIFQFKFIPSMLNGTYVYMYWCKLDGITAFYAMPIQQHPAMIHSALIERNSTHFRLKILSIKPPPQKKTQTLFHPNPCNCLASILFCIHNNIYSTGSNFVASGHNTQTMYQRKSEYSSSSRQLSSAAVLH